MHATNPLADLTYVLKRFSTEPYFKDLNLGLEHDPYKENWKGMAVIETGCSSDGEESHPVRGLVQKQEVGGRSERTPYTRL